MGHKQGPVTWLWKLRRGRGPGESVAVAAETALSRCERMVRSTFESRELVSRGQGRMRHTGQKYGQRPDPDQP